MGRYAEGEALARRGLAIRLAGGHPDTELVARDLVALAALVSGQGRWSEAEAMYVEGIRLLVSLPGDQRPELAVAFNGLGVVHAERGHHWMAARWFERSATLKWCLAGPADPSLAVTLHNLALALERCGEPTRAAELHARALRIFERSLGPEHEQTRRCRRDRPLCPRPGASDSTTPSPRRHK